MNPQRNRIQVGVGGPFVDIHDITNAQSAFQAAVDALPPSGGELFVFPPSAPGLRYSFSGAVLVTGDNVGLRFAPGATLDFASGSSASSLFHVRGRGFSCHGSSVRHSIDSAVSARSVFLIEDLGAVSSSAAATFSACRFEVAQNTSDLIEGFSCIRIQGLDRTNRKGLLVDGCNFVAPPGLSQSVAWIGDEPAGVCGIRGADSLGNVITRNHFSGRDESVRGQSGPAICLHACPETVISSNVFRGLELAITGADDPRKRSTVLRLTTEEQEGHHTLVVGNQFKELGCEYAISASNINYDSVNGNLFGDIGPGARAAFQASGVLLLVCGNGFHGLEFAPGADDAALVALDLVRDAVIAGNAFVRTPAGIDAVRTALESSNVHQPASQVRSSAEA